MSRIYEALRNAEELRSRSGAAAAEVYEGPERRESPRIDLDIELTIYGRSVDELPFYEDAQVMNGNANGGVFLLAAPVSEGQDLLLINNRTSEEQICRVANVRMESEQKSEVSVRFPAPNPEFWQLLVVNK
jgi:hypothetical protein